MTMPTLLITNEDYQSQHQQQPSRRRQLRRSSLMLLHSTNNNSAMMPAAAVAEAITTSSLHSPLHQFESQASLKECTPSSSSRRRVTFGCELEAPPSSSSSPPILSPAHANSELWYNRQDFSQMRRDNRDLMAAQINAADATTTTTTCLRGLETRQQSRQRRQKIDRALEAVLGEQMRQRDMGVCKPEQLAQICGFYTRMCQIEAFRQGVLDSNNNNNKTSIIQHQIDQGPPMMPTQRAAFKNARARTSTLPCALPIRTTDIAIGSGIRKPRSLPTQRRRATIE